MMNLISSVDFSLETEVRGHANINSKTGELTIFLFTIELDKKDNPLISYFEDVGELIDEIVTHELLHMILGGLTDKILDGWHRLICRQDNWHIEQARTCSCPIPCFWRDMYIK
jgi:hypothetical protein